MSITTIYRRLSLHHTLRLLIILIIVAAVVVRLFVPVHGHRTWWSSIFHRDHPATTAQAMTPVPQTADNNARQVLLDFYKKYSAAKNSSDKKKIVTNYSTSDVIAKYISNSSLDPMTCTNNPVTSVQIVSERTLNDGGFGYILTEDLPGGAQAEPQVNMAAQGNTYKISYVGCSPA